MSVIAHAPTAVVPGPQRQWLFGNLKEFGRDQLGTMTRVGAGVRRRGLSEVWTPASCLC